VRGDQALVLFQREVACVEQVQFRVGQVAPERLCPGDGEERVVLSPYDERGRLVSAEVGLPIPVERYVGGVVVKKIQLDGVVPRPVQQRGDARVEVRRGAATRFVVAA